MFIYVVELIEVALTSFDDGAIGQDLDKDQDISRFDFRTSAPSDWTHVSVDAAMKHAPLSNPQHDLPVRPDDDLGVSWYKRTINYIASIMLLDRPI